MSEPTGSINLPKMPLELRRQFAAVCASKGVTMKDRIIELMREDLRAAKPRLVN